MITKVTEGIYRGPRLEDFQPLRDLKIVTVLNLEDDEKEVEREMVVSYKNGIQYFINPMSEIKIPSKVQLYSACQIISYKPFHPIYIHCKHGQDRTGYVIAAYRMLSEGWSFERAYQEAKDNGHKWWFFPYILWPKALKELK
jgi:protein tyrosine/serine phosphatase